MASKRAYKLQEFVAHTSGVNCVKFGRRTSRMLITGGEDLKVNLWAVGKPSALLSLTGLTSPVESVGFDSSEVTIGAGAASGTIKIWDIEEAKVVRTFTGHRSNCASLDFHPFGEFLASGSSDTNMKIWDIRKRRCIHTYKGHTGRIDVLKFTPDGRWIVSGGADDSVKIWDLTAGKLLHDFNLHEGPVNCLDFHPHEFLLATGSADKAVKFWDLETFELVGSSGPENIREYFVTANVVRSMKFNSDGKTLFCGLHENLKVLSWEPIICRDVVDVGWSTLADLTVDGGKLLGCSYNQNCVGVWVVDLMRTEPYAVGSAESNLNGSVNRPVQDDSSISLVFDRLSVSRNSASEIASNTQLKHSMSASKDFFVSASSALTKRLSKEPKTIDLRLTRSDNIPPLSPGVRLDPNFGDDKKRQRASVKSLPVPIFSSKVDLYSNTGVMSHHPLALPAPTYKSMSRISAHSKKASSFVPVVPRHRSKVDAGPILSEAATGDLRVNEPQNIIKGGLAVNHGKEDGGLVKLIDSRSSNKDVEIGCRRITDDVECNKEITETSLRVNQGFDFRMTTALESQNVHECIFQSEPISEQRKYIRETSGHGENNFSMSLCTESVDSNEIGTWYGMSGFEKQNSAARRNPEFATINRSDVIHLSKLMESSGGHAVERHKCSSGPSSSNFDNIQYETTLGVPRWQPSLSRRQNKSTIDGNAMAALMESHQEFIYLMKSRKTKLEDACQRWRGNDKEFLDATLRMSDCAVTADIINILMKNNNCITLDTCTSLLHLASSLFESTYDRHLSIAMEVVLKLVKSFGATISSTLSAAPPVGVDLEAEQRLERCDLCFQELKKVSVSLMSLTRRHGEVGRSAQELNLFLQDIFQLKSI